MIHEAYNNFVHWNYYIALEEDLSKVSRFIEFTNENLNVFSIELAHLLLASSSEIDVVLKALCNLIKPSKDHRNINDYKQTIIEKFPSFANETCYVPRFGLEFQPWINWKDENNPNWWKGYNDVKHHRDSKFNQANLKNTLNSLAALNLVVLYYYKSLISSQGEDLNFKDVTRKFEQESYLIKVNDDYYYHSLVV